MSMERPTFFTKVLRTLRQLTTTKGFSIKQIAEQLQQLSTKRDLKEIKSIVEKSLKYGVKKKILLEKGGKFHLSASKLQCFHNQTDSEKKKKKRVRFKKGKTNINDALKRSKNRNDRRRSRRASKTSRRSVKSKRDLRAKKRNENRNIENSKNEYEETTSTRNRERSPSAKKSKTALIVEKKESKEPLNVTPERDVHDNCVNKNRVRDKQSNVTRPPRLESETELGWQPPRPPTRITRRNKSRHSSKLRRSLDHKYKHHCPHPMERRKHLKDFIPDDKSYRKYKTRSRHNHDHERCEESSDYDSNSKEKTCRKCHHHCSGRCCHQSHHNQEDYLLERKVSNTILDHLNKSLTVLDAAGENLTPFEVFLEANHNKLETIAENISNEEEDPVEEIQSETKEKFEASYIN